jgi:hypothetical protein
MIEEKTHWCREHTVHQPQPAQGLVPSGYHEIVGTVERIAPAATFWGRGKTD